MPIQKAAMKALRQAKKNALKNKIIKDNLRNLIKLGRRSILEKKADEAKKLVTQAVKAADKAVRAKVIRQNTASRIKSNLAKKLNSLIKK